MADKKDFINFQKDAVHSPEVNLRSLKVRS
jgi:hypothetical protein